MSRPGTTRRSMSYQEGSQSNGATEPVASTSRAWIAPTDGPFLTIPVQPEKFKRFRYEDELTSSTVLQGATAADGDDEGHTTFPTLMISNVPVQDKALITVSTVTANEPFRAHPNGLMGRDCHSYVYSKDVPLRPGNNTVVFDDLRIIRVKSVDYKNALRIREVQKIDPFQQGFKHELTKDFRLTELRLCFQVKLRRCKKVLEPIVSTPIYNTRRSTKPQIHHYSPGSGSARGGTKIIILCTVVKEETEVVFYTKPTENEPAWERHAMGLKVHGTQSLYCFAPPYRDTDIKENVTVYFELRRKSDGTRSSPEKFHYLPYDTDEEVINRKKLKIIHPALSLLHQESSTCGNLSPFLTQDIQQFLNSLPCNNPADSDDANGITRASLFDQVISTPNPSDNDSRWSGSIHAPNNGNPFIEIEPEPSHSHREFYRQSSINLPVLHNKQTNSTIMNGNLCTSPNMQPMQTSQSMLQSTQPNWHHNNMSMNMQSTLNNTGQMSYNVPVQSNTMYTSQEDMQTAQVGQFGQYNGYQISEDVQWPNSQFFSNNTQSPEFPQQNMQSESMLLDTQLREYPANSTSFCRNCKRIRNETEQISYVKRNGGNTQYPPGNDSDLFSL
ncbi:nuclear factor NF-kappa-B p110 subunit-like isoform X2 [Spodoptera frugiperda]|uniref:Nuclear factor NF-kappa-B p110 subunit-like isoform X2 n=1 Tax=Spodoptera frugiperda TaxID=7108 RepID=A0A9R0DKT5_SPOFR|nr:nuclear factor NF-kappa-B p110 subunit-like isoform X2 [Spodoptera frugiperda]